MSFCPNCGNQVPERSKFCASCGTALESGTVEITPMPVGMRTVEEIQNFYRNTLQFQEKYIRQYSAGIQMLVSSLMPGEVIEFASHCVIGGLKGGTSAEIAATNRRFLVANTPSSTTRMNSALKGIRRSQTESYLYNTFSGITMQSGLLLGNINISFIDGNISVSVDKKWTEIVYKGLSASFYQHTGGSF